MGLKSEELLIIKGLITLCLWSVYAFGVTRGVRGCLGWGLLCNSAWSVLWGY